MKEMPMIIACEMTDCAYNTDNMCHASAITVGAVTPFCDTFFKKPVKGGDQDVTGSVGACKVESCRFNDSLECIAEGIHVGRHVDHPECDTFSPR